MAALVYGNLALGGAPRWGEGARRFGREIQRNLGIELMAHPIYPAMSDPVTPEADETRLRAILPPWQMNCTSDDFTD
jgi:aminobenzoyl-glutamate utilization protein B